MKVTNRAVAKILDVIDTGLTFGTGNPIPGQMCMEAAVCYALGEPHSDSPTCVSPPLRNMAIVLNDGPWSTPAARAKALRRLAIAQLGTKHTLDSEAFLTDAIRMFMTTGMPPVLRALASLQKGRDRSTLTFLAKLCENGGRHRTAREAHEECLRARKAIFAKAEAHKEPQWKTASITGTSAASAIADASYLMDPDSPFVATGCRPCLSEVCDSVCNAITSAASCLASGSEKPFGQAAAGELMATLAEGIVQILIETGAPGTRFLALTERKCSM